MAPQHSQRIAELEVAITRLHRTEMRLRSVLKSAFTSVESRREARHELDLNLGEARQVEDELHVLVARARGK
jgi:hypothetical protein